jgi:hypothetical protein
LGGLLLIVTIQTSSFGRFGEIFLSPLTLICTSGGGFETPISAI